MTDRSWETQRERELFEQWAIDAGWNVTKHNSIDDDIYLSAITQTLLDCWKARASLNHPSTPAAPETPPECSREREREIAYSAGAKQMREKAVEVIEFLRTSCEDRESCHSDDIEAIQSLPIGESSQAPEGSK